MCPVRRRTRFTSDSATRTARSAFVAWKARTTSAIRAESAGDTPSIGSSSSSRRCAQKSARQRDQLLLAPAELRRLPPTERRDLRQEGGDRVPALVGVTAPLAPRGDQEVVLDGEGADEAPVFGHVADPEPASLEWREADELLAVDRKS